MISTVSVNDPCFNFKVLDSIERTGFVILDTQHEHFVSLYKALEEVWLNEFFNKSNDFKNDYLAPKDSQEGFFPMMSETAKNYDKPDLKEFFQLYDGNKFRFPASFMVKFNETLHVRQFLIKHVGYKVLKVLSQDLGVDLESMVHNSGRSLLRVIHYPKIENLSSEALRAYEHEDINFITTLPVASVSGLEVKMLDGTWYKVRAEVGQVVVNVGDMIQMLSNGKYKSTTHRVTNESPEISRISMPVFIHPKADVNLGPMTAGEYLDQRLKEIGLK